MSLLWSNIKSLLKFIILKTLEWMYWVDGMSMIMSRSLKI